MAEQQPGASSQTAAHDLQMIEQILDVMPDDRRTLEAALLAAGHCGDEEKIRVYRMRLADQLRQEGATADFKALLDQLREDADPRAREWVLAHDNRGHSRTTADATPMDVAGEYISDEIDLAWRLFDRGFIHQEDYASVVKDLTEQAAGTGAITVSVLHALEARQHRQLDTMLEFLSQSTRTPYISLAAFTMRSELLPYLHRSFAVKRGALVFGLIGKELMVALLNPVSARLRHEIVSLSGHACHFYLTRASLFDAAVTALYSSTESTG